MRTLATALAATACATCFGPASARADLVAFDCTVPPTALTNFFSVPVGTGMLTLIRSGHTGGVYAVDLDSNGQVHETLTASAELVSQVFADGLSYAYSGELSGLGEGGFLGGSAPGFAISATSPLIASAGPDRIVGTADDLQTFISSSTSDIGSSMQAWGIVMNSSSGLETSLLAPSLVPPEPVISPLALAALGLLTIASRKLRNGSTA